MGQAKRDLDRKTMENWKFADALLLENHKVLEFMRNSFAGDLMSTPHDLTWLESIDHTLSVNKAYLCLKGESGGAKPRLDTAQG